MIELTEVQATAIRQNGQQPAVIVNPPTWEIFVLLPKEVFDAMQRWLAPLKPRWDNPQDEGLTQTPMSVPAP
jgi:hypothetical protein